MVIRCGWATKGPELMYYHDLRWGKPVYELNKLFHALALEIFQAGLTFQTVLKFESGLTSAFANFDVNEIAKYSDAQINVLYDDALIIRNHVKIDAVVHNAQVIVENPDKFKQITWGNTNNIPLDRQLTDKLNMSEIEVFIKKYTDQYKKMGLTRMGPVTTYSFLEAVGVVNDHIMSCEFR
ncbi:DNA-3-methyladenine glycosylase I [Lentilactobacillus kosonis]|uniref:DNA-3-methyladenine glycosylase n=1 Tax=Lentilactobacillus kosonis TaxID=2810561 RepID=A0A401FN30_9LACO|nr:DNA-3-methyladenine glycosylase I [Lentilactobacillus kosonis]GAY73790.1 DNA-3-methyladenine glycosylase [Lentilactobacillus kosonis]